MKTIEIEVKKTRKPKYRVIHLSLEEMDNLMLPVNGKGGFQSLIKKLQIQTENNTLYLFETDIKRINSYTQGKGKGGFQSRLRPVVEQLSRKGVT